MNLESSRKKFPEGSPVDISSLQDEFDQPTAGETVAPEIAAVADNTIEEIEEDAVQLVEEKDDIEAIEPAPVEIGKSQHQCRQTDVPDATNDADRYRPMSQSSFGAALKKIWTKIKGALFS